MRSTQTRLMGLLAVVAGTLVLVPVLRAETGAADVACSVRAYVTSTASMPFSIPFPIAVAASAPPTPVVRGTGPDRTLTVTGTADVAHAPDTVYVDARLTTSGPDAPSASCANERSYDALRARVGPIPIVGISTLPAFGQTTNVVRANPSPAAVSPEPAASPGWLAHRNLRLQTTPARWRDAVAAVEAVHGTVTAVQFAFNDLPALHELAAGPAMRDATERASEAAKSEHVPLGPLLRVEAGEVARSATLAAIPGGTALAGASGGPQSVTVRTSLTATYAIAPAANAVRPAAALIVVHPLGFASAPPASANVTASFSDRGNDRAALLYRHESAYDALWTRLRALGFTVAQVPMSSPGIVENRPLPAEPPSAVLAYRLYREVHVYAVPIPKLDQVLAAFSAAGATSAEVAFTIGDRVPIQAAAVADLRRNGAAEARAIASAAGLRLVDEPYTQMIGFPLGQVTIYRIPMGSPDRPTIVEPPATIEGLQRATLVYAATR